MKKTWIDHFRREYEVRLSVSAQDVTGAAEQYFGIAVNSPEGISLSGDGKKDAGIRIISMLKELRPEVLRIDTMDADAAFFLDFCRKEEIHPHLVFHAGQDPAEIRGVVEACVSDFAENELWDPVRFYELSADPDAVASAGDAAIAGCIREMKEKAEMIRALDPLGRIILGGIAPMGNSRARAEVWDQMLLEGCGEVMDMIGITFGPPADPGSIRGREEEGIEINTALADEIRLGLQRLERLIFENATDAGIRAAVTGWHYLTDGTAQQRQDCVFFASVITAVRSFPALIALNEAGPLFGKEGLLGFENGMVYGNVFYYVLQMAARSLPVGLKIGDAEPNRPGPAYEWEGIPGVLDGRKFSLLEADASRSRDGKRLYLFLTNRSPFKQAVARIRYYGFPGMHPAEAMALRSGTMLDENTAAAPEKVYCKSVRLRKFRDTDHVTLEIPECSTVCMLLDSSL